MEKQNQKFQTSFIPKKPESITADNFKRGKKSNIISIIATLIFLATLVFAGGVYGYKLTIQKQIQNQLSELKAARERLDESLIANANRLNDRISAVKEILDKHKAPSEIFSLLEQYTLGSVRFTSLSYDTDAQGIITINANGIGTGFQSVVLQSDQFGDTGVLRDAVFSSVQPNQEGYVNFAFQSSVDPQFVLYRKSLIATPANSVQNQQPVKSNINTVDDVPDVEVLEEDPIDNSLNNNQ